MENIRRHFAIIIGLASYAKDQHGGCIGCGIKDAMIGDILTDLLKEVRIDLPQFAAALNELAVVGGRLCEWYVDEGYLSTKICTFFEWKYFVKALLNTEAFASILNDVSPEGKSLRDDAFRVRGIDI